MSTVSGDICPICHDETNLPFKLDCSHSFCFLCIKRAYEHNKSCPYCRQPIIMETFQTPQITSEVPLGTTQWLYSGKKFGWWNFDPNSNSQLETAYRAGDTTCDLEIMGYVYTVNFQTMTQSSTVSQAVRKVKRCATTDTVTSKGIAGLSYHKNPPTSPTSDSNSNHTSASDSESDSD